MLISCALGAASCGTKDCNEVCAMLQQCGVFPGAFGADSNACAARCRESSARARELTRACVDGVSCDEVKGGRCATW